LFINLNVILATGSTPSCYSSTTTTTSTTCWSSFSWRWRFFYWFRFWFSNNFFATIVSVAIGSGTTESSELTAFDSSLDCIS
ncbi:hypothetical protein FWK35_00011107, partial [Aphis craccivora]